MTDKTLDQRLDVNSALLGEVPFSANVYGLVSTIKHDAENGNVALSQNALANLWRIVFKSIVMPYMVRSMLSQQKTPPDIQAALGVLELYFAQRGDFNRMLQSIVDVEVKNGKLTEAQLKKFGADAVQAMVQHDAEQAKAAGGLN